MCQDDGAPWVEIILTLVAIVVLGSLLMCDGAPRP